MSTDPKPDRVTAIYDAIDAFQRTHRLPGLQHAQLRGLLAEHLARAVPVESAPSAVRARVLHDAADVAEDVAERLRKDHEFERSTGALDVMTELRRLAAERVRDAADRSRLLLWAADRLERMPGYPRLVLPEELLTELRRLAAEQPTNTDCPSCDAGIPHDAHCPTPETHNWGCGCPTDDHPAALGTLPAWLYQRFMPGGVGWERLDGDDRSYWEHQARAVRRAVARGGFRPEPARPVVVEQPDTQTREARCTCGDGGDCFVPLGHYTDCPANTQEGDRA